MQRKPWGCCKGCLGARAVGGRAQRRSLVHIGSAAAPAQGTHKSVEQLLTDLNAGTVPTDIDIAVAPPFIFLDYVKSNIAPQYKVAAQNCWVKSDGAFTGEISAEMLNDANIPWVITGHSERRSLCGESNRFVGEKTGHALEVGLKVIACIGETLDQRNNGNLYHVLDTQMQAIYNNVSDWSKVVIAYEPVWAIGTGVVATPAQAQEVRPDGRAEGRRSQAGSRHSRGQADGQAAACSMCWGGGICSRCRACMPPRVSRAGHTGQEGGGGSQPARSTLPGLASSWLGACRGISISVSCQLCVAAAPAALAALAGGARALRQPACGHRPAPHPPPRPAPLQVHAYLRKWLSDKLGAEAASVIRVIYGGSVNDNNCEELAGMEDIDGFLVGPRARAGGGGVACWMHSFAWRSCRRVLLMLSQHSNRPAVLLSSGQRLPGRAAAGGAAARNHPMRSPGACCMLLPGRRWAAHP